jgi:DNA invertase Pin-like site-specific DNA recombinase
MREGKVRKIGYARVSSRHQNLDRQLGALRAERWDQIFAEKMSGRSLKGRPQLEKAIDALGTGDVLVVAEWDRATRSMMDGIAIIDRVLARGALVKVLDKAHLDLTSTIGKGLLAFLSAIAQDERERIAKRAGEGRDAARAAGRRWGRKPKLNEHQQAEALRRLAGGESFRAIARSYRVSHTTVSRLASA